MQFEIDLIILYFVLSKLFISTIVYTLIFSECVVTMPHVQIVSKCSNVEKLLKYDRKQLIPSHMYSPSEMCFECRRCSMKNLFLKTHSLIKKCTKIISYLMDNVS
jgi:hypothetical protein